MEDVTAVILAGGLGTRLKSVVANRPKVLATVGDKPFLTYLFDHLLSFKVCHVVLCTGYLGEQIEEAFGRRYKTLTLTYSQEPEPLGTGGALRYALPHCRSNPVLVMNGDSFCRANLGLFHAWYQAQNISTGALLLTKVADVQRYGQVQLRPGGRVTSFVEKGVNQGAGWVNAGVYLLDQALIAKIPAGRAVSIEKESFPAWLSQGLYGFPIYGDFIDIGLPETYALAGRFFAP